MSMSANGVSQSTAPAVVIDRSAESKPTDKIQPSDQEKPQAPAATVEISPEAKQASSDSK